jgi:hypothetical protein
VIKSDNYNITEKNGHAFGKNEQVKKVFWTLFISMAGLVLARVVHPVTVQQVMDPGIFPFHSLMQCTA